MLPKMHFSVYYNCIITECHLPAVTSYTLTLWNSLYTAVNNFCVLTPLLHRTRPQSSLGKVERGETSFFISPSHRPLRTRCSISLPRPFRDRLQIIRDDWGLVSYCIRDLPPKIIG